MATLTVEKFQQRPYNLAKHKQYLLHYTLQKTLASPLSECLKKYHIHKYEFGFKVKMPLAPQPIHRFNVIQQAFLYNLIRWFWNWYANTEDLREAKHFFKKWEDLYYQISRVNIKLQKTWAVQYWHKNTHKNQWNRIKSSEKIHRHMVIWFWQLGQDKYEIIIFQQANRNN